MLTKLQIHDAKDNLECVLEALCSGQAADLGQGDIGWVRVALRALNGEMPPVPTTPEAPRGSD